MTLSLAGRPFELLVFDMDGVLVSTSDCHARAYRDLWQRLELAGPAYELIAGRRTAEVVQQVTATLQPSARQLTAWVDAKQRRARELIESTELCFDDTVACLQALTACGVPLAIGTAASAASAHALLERYALDGYFRQVVTADDIVQGKPAPEVYRRIIDDQGVPAAATLVIEDSLAGLQAAVAAGAATLSVRTGVAVDDAAFLGAYPDLASLQQALGVVA